jgi:hypothetical protein
MQQNMKTAVFWDVAPGSPGKTDGRCSGFYFLHHKGDEGSKHLSNIGQRVAGYLSQHPRRQSLFRAKPVYV